MPIKPLIMSRHRVESLDQSTGGCVVETPNDGEQMGNKCGMESEKRLGTVFHTPSIYSRFVEAWTIPFLELEGLFEMNLPQE